MRPDAEIGTPRRTQSQSWSRDQYLALAVGILGLLASPIALYISHIFAKTLPATVILGSLCYLLLSRAREQRRSPQASSLEELRALVPREATLLAPSIVLLTCTAAIVLAVITGERSTGFYVLMMLAAIVYLLQVISVRERDLWPGFLLVQLLVVMASLRLPALALTPSWIGVDILSHTPNYAATMLETASLYSGLGESKYLAAPFYHLLVVATALLGDLSVRGGLYLSLGLAMIAAPLFVYAIARRLGVPARWAIFTTALFGLTDYLSYWTLHLIPSSLGVLFLLSLLMLFAHQFSVDSRTAGRASVPIALLLVALAVTDQVSSFIMVVFLGTALVAQYGLSIYERLAETVETGVDMTGYAVFFAGVVLLIWSITPLYGETFTIAVIELATESFGEMSLLSSSGGGEAAQADTETSQLGELLTYISRGSFLFLTFGAALGTFACCRAHAESQTRWTLISAAAVTGVMALVPPLIGVSTLLPGRWFSFLYALLAILFAIGLAVLSSEEFRGRPTISMGALSRRGAIAFSLLLIAMSVVFPIAAIASPVATLDAPILSDEEPRRALDGTEQHAADTLREITDSSESQPIRSDAYFATVLARPGEQEYYTAVIPDAHANGAEPSPNEDVIYRTYQADGAPEFVADDGELYVTQIERSQLCQDTDHIAFDNPDVRYCQSSA